MAGFKNTKGTTIKWKEGFDADTADLIQFANVETFSGMTITKETQTATLLEDQVDVTTATKTVYGDIELGFLVKDGGSTYDGLYDVLMSDESELTFLSTMSGLGITFKGNAVLTNLAAPTETGAFQKFTATLKISGSVVKADIT